jgi:hypothetical protein
MLPELASTCLSLIMSAFLQIIATFTTEFRSDIALQFSSPSFVLYAAPFQQGVSNIIYMQPIRG